MGKINLFIIDMAHASNTSGVDRYIETLIKSLVKEAYINIYRIQLKNDCELLFPKVETINDCITYTIPLPQEYNTIIAERYWIRKYNEQIYRITESLYIDKENIIIHIHTLNLIDLALLIKKKINCKIITHLHCIPWKGIFNNDIQKFNRLYTMYYMGDKNISINSKLYITNNCEAESFILADAVVCVTECAIDFLDRIFPDHANCYLIPNGIDDREDKHTKSKKLNKEDVNILYVGAVTNSKGLNYILEALRIVRQKGYTCTLTIAGSFEEKSMNKLKDDNQNQKMNIKGRLPFNELKLLYETSDIGIISSLQEQASYVAIEMAMFSLPIVTTAVDGLDEIFTDNINALKVNTKFSEVFGLTVDTDMMAEQIIKLIESHELRTNLGKNARRLYENELNIDLMRERTVELYKKVLWK
ncbi:MAG: glycosyltransferase family 4 protein [Bacteroidales bacterium]|nr:glycosyltransferase family 4 protein [Bacteroidales bacterium]